MDLSSETAVLPKRVSDVLMPVFDCWRWVYYLIRENNGEFLIMQLFLALSMSCLMVSTALALPGDLDTSFGGTGIVITDIGSSAGFAESVAVQPDGKIIAAGHSEDGATSDFALVRYNTDGTLDTTFGGDGIVTTDISSDHNASYSVFVQEDGTLLAAGDSNIGSNCNFAIVRYNQNGTLDTTFNGDGIVTTAIGGLKTTAWSVVVQDDKVVVGGHGYDGANNDFVLARYNLDGSLDITLMVMVL